MGEKIFINVQIIAFVYSLVYFYSLYSYPVSLCLNLVSFCFLVSFLNKGYA